MVRDENQDRVETLQLEDGVLAVVCDGMGGAKAGNVASQLAEQTVRIGAVAAALYATPGRDAGERCTLVLGATALSEAVSCTLMALFCRGEARRCFGGKRAQTPPEASRRLWDILWRAAGCWPARCTRQRTCWCPPAWPST